MGQDNAKAPPLAELKGRFEAQQRQNAQLWALTHRLLADARRILRQSYALLDGWYAIFDERRQIR